MSAASVLPNTHIYEKRSLFKTSLAEMVAFHAEPATMPKLSPPPIFVQVHRDDRVSLTEGELEFTLWFGPVPIHWLARHEPGPTETSFADVMVEGPMAYWRHEHIFEELDNHVALIDRVTLAHRKGLTGLITRFLFDGIPLRILFLYRHMRTRLALR